MNLMDFAERREAREEKPDWESLKSGISRLYLKTEEFWQPEDEWDIASRAIKARAIFRGATKIMKQGKIKFLIIRDFICQDSDEHICDDIEFDKEEDAIEWAESECEFINECSRRGLWFDGRRYLWKFEVVDGIFRVKEKASG